VLFAIWLMVGAAFGLACGLMAIRQNRSASGWFLVGLTTGPIGLIVLMTRQRRERPSFL
jgi:hypothetical protein